MNCVWSDWSDWSDCSLTCGTGTRTRSRVIETHEENGGTACTGNSVKTKQFDCGTCLGKKIILILTYPFIMTKYLALERSIDTN